MAEHAEPEPDLSPEASMIRDELRHALLEFTAATERAVAALSRAQGFVQGVRVPPSIRHMETPASRNPEAQQIRE